MKKIICLCGFLFLFVSAFAQVKRKEEVKDTAFLKLISQLKEAKEDTIKVRLLLKISIRIMNEDLDKAMKYVEPAINISVTINYFKGLGDSYVIAANIHAQKGDFNNALNYYNKALEICSKYDKKSTSNVLYNTAIVYLHKAEYPKALELLLRSLKIDEIYKNKSGMVWTLNDIAYTYKMLNNFPKALEYNKKAYQLSVETNDKRVTTSVLNNIGNIYSDQKKFDVAIQYFQKSKDISQEINDISGVAIAINNMASSYVEMKNYNKALSLFRSTIHMFNPETEKKYVAIVYTSIALANMELQQFDSAIVYFQKGLKLAQEARAKHTIVDNYEGLSQAYNKMKNYKLAYEYSDLYSQIKDSIYNDKLAEQTTEMETKYQTEKKEQELILKEKDIELLEKNKTTKNYLLIGLLLLLLLTGAIALLWIRNHKQKQREVELKNVELEQKLLRLQMNPHFIFNSLSSISGQMLQNLNLAREYLAKFARLMRLILENSREAYVAMKNEVDALNYYLILEQQRFKDKFDFKMEIDPTINLDELEIPPMLIQPHIENAILHGVTPGEKKGMITVRFIRESETKVRCEIEDNGIGRKKAGENKKAGGVVLHKSLALEITQERLKTLGEETDQALSFKIDDLEDENHVPLGTRVTLTLPSRGV